MKISVIGIGKVGSTISFVLAKGGLASELVLYNRTREIAHAEAIDIQQAVALTPYRLVVRDGELEDTANSDIIVIAVSAPMPKNMINRNELYLQNTQIMQTLIPPLARFSPNAIFVNVSNPVDALTYQILQIARQQSEEINWQRVIGTGTLIDSARFRDLLSTQLGIHPADINAYILGEHGDSQFAALSSATSGGALIDANPLRQQMVEKAKQSAWTIFKAKGYTNYTVSLAMEMIVRSIVEDSRYTLPVTVLIDGYCDVFNCCLSVPCVVGRQGVHYRLETRLNEAEVSAFQNCARVVQQQIQCVHL
ncbi:lactate dehydrogenase [Leptolyngbyaceae cyanobacterium CCMR0082]|uniref:Lactate dehydrogenase n=1 Tax=Adonisia turfae CCMR0082 TaxID=2304604 RepID=A0A6M0RYN7_9CYAN|nr:lactate dehydrogenase [Adonisia turfae]NEZ61328.1 lactate dehydrogenase [Adonisia turfae CCMR0082]